MTLIWRWLNGPARAHLSEPGNHRALCGADVLGAPEEREPDAVSACRICRDRADYYGYSFPPLVKASARSTDRSTFNLPL